MLPEISFIFLLIKLELTAQLGPKKYLLIGSIYLKCDHMYSHNHSFLATSMV